MSRRGKRTGPKSAPVVRPSAEFVAAVRDVGVSKTALAILAGFSLPQFSTLLHTAATPHTPLLAARLARLAELLDVPADRLVESVR